MVSGLLVSLIERIVRLAICRRSIPRRVSRKGVTPCRVSISPRIWEKEGSRACMSGIYKWQNSIVRSIPIADRACSIPRRTAATTFSPSLSTSCAPLPVGQESEGKIVDTMPVLPGRLPMPVSIALEKLADIVVTGHAASRNACLANCRPVVHVLSPRRLFLAFCAVLSVGFDGLFFFKRRCVWYLSWEILFFYIV